MRAGRPTIIRPFFGDQSFWAERVESLRVGIPLRDLTVRTLADALHRATTDALLVQSAEQLGRQIRKENGVATAIESIYRDLEYAISLVKPKEPNRIRNEEQKASQTDDSSEWDMLSDPDSTSSEASEQAREEYSVSLPDSWQSDSDGRRTPSPPEPRRLADREFV